MVFNGGHDVLSCFAYFSSQVDRIGPRAIFIMHLLMFSLVGRESNKTQKYSSNDDEDTNSREKSGPQTDDALSTPDDQ